jgi:hypothetical protein
VPAPQHYRLIYSGILGTVADPFEEWSMGLSLGMSGDPFLVRSDLQTLVNALAPHWGTHLKALCAPTARLQRVRVAAVDGTGHTPREASGAFVQADWTGDVAGTAVGSLPPQITVAMSLHSLASGPTGRGRFFLPSPYVGQVTDGLMTTATQTTFTNALKAFVNAINATCAATVGGSSGPVVIASGGSSSQGIPPALRTVAAVSVGRRLDVMRSRGNRIAESRVLTPL